MKDIDTPENRIEALLSDTKQLISSNETLKNERLCELWRDAVLIDHLFVGKDALVVLLAFNDEHISQVTPMLASQLSIAPFLSFYENLLSHVGLVCIEQADVDDKVKLLSYIAKIAAVKYVNNTPVKQHWLNRGKIALLNGVFKSHDVEKWIKLSIGNPFDLMLEDIRRSKKEIDQEVYLLANAIYSPFSTITSEYIKKPIDDFVEMILSLSIYYQEACADWKQYTASVLYAYCKQATVEQLEKIREVLEPLFTANHTRCIAVDVLCELGKLHSNDPQSTNSSGWELLSNFINDLVPLCSEKM